MSGIISGSESWSRTGSGEPLVVDDAVAVNAGAAAASSGLAAADMLEIHIITRLMSRTDGAVRALLATIASLQEALAASRPSFAASARRVQRWRSQWFDKGIDETDASEKLLTATASMCAQSLSLHGDELACVASALLLLSPLLGSSTFPRMSSVVGLSGEAVRCVGAALSEFAYVQSGVSPFWTAVSGPGLSYFLCGPSDRTGAQNWIRVDLCDELGHTVRGVEVGDLSVRACATGEVAIRGLRIEEGAFVFEFSVGDGNVGCVTFQASSYGTELPSFESKASVLRGVEVRSIKLEVEFNNVGVAVSPDGRTMAVSNASGKVYFHSLPSGDLVTTTAVPDARKSCFTTHGTLLTVNQFRRSIVELDVSRGIVRSFGQEALTSSLEAIACSDTIVAVTQTGTSDDDELVLFDVENGAFLRKFVLTGAGNCRGICFSNDGSGIITATNTMMITRWSIDTGSPTALLSATSPCVSKFSDPWDVKVLPSGRIIVCNRGLSNIVDFSPDCSEVNTFTAKDGRPLQCANGIAYHNGELYVLENTAGKVTVFQ